MTQLSSSLRVFVKDVRRRLLGNLAKFCRDNADLPAVFRLLICFLLFCRLLFSSCIVKQNVKIQYTHSRSNVRHTTAEVNGTELCRTLHM